MRGVAPAPHHLLKKVDQNFLRGIFRLNRSFVNIYDNNTATYKR